MSCPNCGQSHGVIQACLVGVILGVLADRGYEISEDAPSHVDVDGLWERLAPMIDGVGRQLEDSPARVAVLDRQEHRTEREAESPDVAMEGLRPGAHLPSQ